MRLICGVVRSDEVAVSEDLLCAMVAQMDVPRLRPQVTLWREGPVGLAVLEFAGRSTATTLPRDDDCVIAADVRLDEPEALAGMINVKTGQPEDGLLLAAFQRLGSCKLDHVLGDFAFAIWDREAGRLLCGRDAFGVRPLSYVHRPGKLFAFASMPAALYGSGLVAKQIDEEAMARRVAADLRHDDSLIVGIRRLPPAHIVEVSRDEIRLRRYWQLDRTAVGRRQCSHEEAAREMNRLVSKAVRCRLPDHGEVGAQLSGGLDSPAVTVLAARERSRQGRRLHAYSFLDPQRADIPLADEREFIEAVVRQERNIDWTAIHRPVGASTGDGIFDAAMIKPLPDVAERLQAAAEAQGVTVMLSGWGGDEGATFDGRGALAELFRRRKWRVLAREISALSKTLGRPRWRIFRAEVLGHLWAGTWMLRLARGAIGRQHDLGALFQRCLSQAARDRLAVSRDEPIDPVAGDDGTRWRLLNSPHIAERMEIHAHIGARHGIAFAFPLLDRRVVEFALSLPSELFVRDGLGRRPFRDAMLGVLPDKLRLERRKLIPFPTIMIDNVSRRDDLLAKIEVYGKNAVIRRTLDLAWLRRQVEAFPSTYEIREDLRSRRQLAAAPTIAAALRGLEAAAYLEQHAGKRVPAADRRVDE